VRRALLIYRAFLRARFKVLLEYRASLVLGVASTLTLQVVSVASLFVVLRQVGQVGGWRFEELLLAYGLLVTSRSLEHMFADNLWVVSIYLEEGSFDRFLVRPIDPLFHLLADRFHHHGLGNLAAGLYSVAYAWSALGLPVTPGRVGYTAVAVLSGGLIFVALNLATASTAFWLVHSLPVTRVVHELHELAKYPLTIYRPGLRWLLTWVIPFGFASYYPACALLGRATGPGPWAGPAVALALFAGAYGLWRLGLARYEGTGS
jgi:ABC-2 type transport system permease protein